MKTTRWLAVLALVLGLVLAACGDDEESSGGGGEATSTAAARNLRSIAV